MTDAPFGTVLSALVTIFHDDGSIDLEQTQKVAKHLVDHGHDGIVVSGTTGESPTTTPAEDGELLAAVKDAVGDRAKIVAGIGTNDTRTSVELAKQAARIGADGLLLVTPYYSKPGQRGILEHFRTVTSTTDVPVVLYDVPGRTGSPITLETYREVSTWDSVVAVKEAAGDFARGTKLLDLGYTLYSGDDALTLAWLAHGAVGVISVSAHVIGDQTRTLIDSFAAGDIETARKTYARMLPAIDAIMGVPNYGATTAKAALELTGVIDNRTVRGPLVALDESEVEALRAGLEASGLL
ncbi:dihydrodipicolinate synthase [Nocardioides albertanoniae]|uniref:4-hydroxy-tetrahydrodipicolinate synthase n=1 Tax=Nocardioides albertanoniae TaxID=1175486 RepID=A0A543A629_9ACTN|nr:4-hydroxy-tetrahydrodipicolinate synthase [Nocardioides albertanoniae]TQL68051.1 dihydrodipicolinate synthase [Nocardioides albertanoniae]